MSSFLITLFLAALLGQAAATTLNISALTSDVESDWSAIYHSSPPVLLGNDGSAASGGIRAWYINDSNTFYASGAATTGRTKVTNVLYSVGDRDYAVTVAQPDSIIRLFQIPALHQLEPPNEKWGPNPTYKALGDWSALCTWSTRAGNNYFFLFGKSQVLQFIVDEYSEGVGIYKVKAFDVPIEASACAVTTKDPPYMFFSGDDSSTVYKFALAESMDSPQVETHGEAEDSSTGLAVYAGLGQDLLFVALEDKVAVHDAASFSHLGTFDLGEDIEIQGLSVLQAAIQGHSAGALTFAIEYDGGKGFGMAGLADLLAELGIEPNNGIESSLRTKDRKASNPICRSCSGFGYCTGPESNTCECFTGFTGDRCKQTHCPSAPDCNGHGKCRGPDLCECDDGWGGLFCAFKVVEPKYETEAHGADGDDPAIWIHPEDRNASTIITTTKSEEGAGLAVFDLQGNLLQVISAPEPNNVDVIYGFKMGNRTTDLAYAACRDGDTLCFFEIQLNGTLSNIPGGSQTVKDDFSVYGSCVYQSKTGKVYVFVNAKTSEYLQYEVNWDFEAGAISTTLVRSFMVGGGGQVEGCVVDNDKGWLFLGEEPKALWRYDAEPDGSASQAVKVAEVSDGTLHADVEGVTIIQGKNGKGFLLVSTQGVSAYNVYQLEEPHDYVMTFTIGENLSKQIDAASNTDGIAAVGTALGNDFPSGLIVVHDDANQLPDAGTSAEASFKLVSLADVLPDNLLGGLGEWDPRE